MQTTQRNGSTDIVVLMCNIRKSNFSENIIGEVYSDSGGSWA